VSGWLMVMPARIRTTFGCHCHSAAVTTESCGKERLKTRVYRRLQKTRRAGGGADVTCHASYIRAGSVSLKTKKRPGNRHRSFWDASCRGNFFSMQPFCVTNVCFAG